MKKERINYFNCMKQKCEQCRYNEQCKKEEEKYEIQNKQQNVEYRIKATK